MARSPEEIVLVTKSSNGYWNIYIPESVPRAEVPLPNLLPSQIEPSRSLATLAAELPIQYRQLLGDYRLPNDDGETLANALRTGNLAHYSDGSVKEGCASHAYTLRTQDDDDTSAITGGGPTCGNPLTVSSFPLRTQWIFGRIYMDVAT